MSWSFGRGFVVCVGDVVFIGSVRNFFCIRYGELGVRLFWLCLVFVGFFFYFWGY